MKIAVLNAGSSSLKYKLFDMTQGILLESKLVENITNHEEALEHLSIDFTCVDAVGHRVVHGGEKFCETTLVDDAVLQEIDKLIPLAPLHNGANLAGIKASKKYRGDIPQVAVFDTAFHATLPKEAYLYALPMDLYTKHQIRRYGFHGTSHSYVMKEAARELGKEVNAVNLITLHLGNGASVCAIENGKSIDTSMGFTPLEGLVMGSRSGDIDAGVIIYLQRELGLSYDEVDTLLNKESGLVGLCQTNDLRLILNREDSSAELAIDIMVRRVQKYIGSYMALLDSVDAIVFTGGIGENSSVVREKIMSSSLFASTPSLVIKTDEELEIANEVVKLLKNKDK